MVLTPLGRFEWERMLRRLRLGKTTKLVGLTLATYANKDGQNAHPGVDRLAAEVEADERTVRRALVRLRDLGLIHLVYDGSSAGRRRLASEYRLTMPEDLADRVEIIPSPATDHRALLPGDEVDHRALLPAVPAPITGQQRPDHRALVTDHRALVTGTPGTGARPPHMTTDGDHNRDQAALRWAAQPTTAREGCGTYGHEHGGWPCSCCASETKAAG